MRDEIEVYLGYIVAFNTEFALNTKINSMLYPAVSCIKAKDIIQTRGNLSNKPFDEAAEIHYQSFLVESEFNQLKQLNRSNNSNSLNVKSLSKLRAENNAQFLNYLLENDLVNMLLRHLNPKAMGNIEANIDQQIKTELAKSQTALEKLDENLADYAKQSNALRDELNSKIAKIRLTEKAAPLLDLARQLSVDLGLD